MKIKSRISFIIIYLLIVSLAFAILLLVFKGDILLNKKQEENQNSNSSQSTLIDNNLVKGPTEFLDILGLDIYIKHEGELTIYINEKYREDYTKKGYEDSLIMKESGLVIKIDERIKEIKPFETGGDGIIKEILVLSTEGNLYKLNIDNILNNNTDVFKYIYDKKISSLSIGKIEYLDLTKRTLAKLSDDSNHLIGKENILDDINKYQLGKKVRIIPLTSYYIVIENDDTVRIGDFKIDKYFSVTEEIWINKDSDTSKYKYLSNMLGIKYKVIDFEYVKINVTKENQNYDIYNIFFISQDGELLLLKYSEYKEEDNSENMIPTVIKLDKQVYKLELDKTGAIKYGIKDIVFTDGSKIDFEETVKEYIIEK